MGFCKFCGKQLEDGQVCTCERAQQEAANAVRTAERVAEAADAPAAEAAAPVQTQAQTQTAAQSQTAAQAQAAKETVVTAAKGIVPYAKKFFNDPSGAIRDTIQADDMMTSVTMLVVRALAMGLAIYGVLRYICETMEKFGGRYSYRSSVKVSASILHSILYGALIGVIGVALLTLVVFALNKIQKGDATIKTSFHAASANSVMVSLMLLACFVLSFVSIKLSLMFLGLALLSWPIFDLLAAQTLCPRQNEVFWVCYLVGVVLIFFIGWKTMPNLFLNAVGAVKVTVDGKAETLTSMIDEVKNGLGDLDLSFGELLSKALDGLSSQLMYGLF